jgi:hypothetical protein
MAVQRPRVRNANVAANLVALPGNKPALVVLLVCFSWLMLSFATAADLSLDRIMRVLPTMGNPAVSWCSSSRCARDCRRKGGALVKVCESLCTETCRGR